MSILESSMFYFFLKIIYLKRQAFFVVYLFFKYEIFVQDFEFDNVMGGWDILYVYIIIL